MVGLPDFTTQQVCPVDTAEAADEVTTAYPDGWYIRIMFDELLDPEIETLTEVIDEDTGEPTGQSKGSIAGTRPVTLQCESAAGGGMVNVDYDGYYSPSGNRVTWPLGPSLVIKPNDPTLIATGTKCQVTINANVVDKGGTAVDADQRGPYTFQVAPITALVTTPSDADPADSDPATPVTAVDALSLYFDNFYFQFNTAVRTSSFCTDTDFGGTFPAFTDASFGAGACDQGTEKFTLTPPVTPADAGGDWGQCSNSTGAAPAFCSTAADCGVGARCDSSYVYTLDGTKADDEIGIGYNTPLKTETEYTFALNPGIKLVDRCGRENTVAMPGTEDLLAVRFKTNKIDLNAITPATGETSAPSKKLTLDFNTVVDPSSLDASEFSIDPVPAATTVGQTSGGDLVIGGNYAPDTSYTFTLNAGATVTDYYGATFTNATEQKITWKTQPKVQLTTSTADNTVITKLTTQQLVGVSLTFNANMDVASFTSDDYTFVNKAGTAVSTFPAFTVGNGSGAAFANCSASSKTCQFRIRADLPPDDYTFTLKAGATISDKLGNVYTQAADRVIHITVNAPAAPVQCL